MSYETITNTPIGEPVASCVTRLLVGRYATLTYN